MAEDLQSAPPARAATSEVAATPVRKVSRRRAYYALVPGLAVISVIAAVATGLGHLAPIVGAPVFGIVLGIMLAPVLRRHDRTLQAGRAFAGKRVLQASIVVLGTGFSLSEIARAGLRSLPVMLGTLCLALLAAWWLGRLLRVDDPLRTLIGVGTGICGASAIAATTGVVAATEIEVAYAISTIFMFNIVAVLLFPLLGHLLGLSQHAFGLWAGTAVNDTSSVVAAAYSYGQSAGAYAVVVKLTRTLMIIPIIVGLALWHSRKDPRHSRGTTLLRPDRPSWYRVFPMFIAYFLLASVVNTLGGIPDGWHAALASAAVFLITVALTAIGLSVRFGDFRRTGHKSLVLGLALWVTVAVSSLLLQAVTDQL